MLVKSTSKSIGFFGGQRIDPGGKFTISVKTDTAGNEITVEQQFSKRWMQIVEVEKPKKQKKTSSKKTAIVKTDV